MVYLGYSLDAYTVEEEISIVKMSFTILIRQFQSSMIRCLNLSHISQLTFRSRQLGKLAATKGRVEHFQEEPFNSHLMISVSDDPMSGPQSRHSNHIPDAHRSES